MRFPLSIPRGRRFDVLGFGTNAVDYLITVPAFPRFAGKVELREYVRLAGGEVASTIAGLQRLGLTTAYVGSFGTDEAGDFGIASLEREGVDLSHIRRVDGANTQIAFILIDERSGERTVIWKRDPRLASGPEDVPVDLAADASFIHMTPHDTAACIRMAAKAKASGAIISLDIDNILDGLNELLFLVDVLVCSGEFPEMLTGTTDRREALAQIRDRFRNSLVGMTLGENGSLLLCGDEFIETPGISVPGGCKDTTGAGDAFRTGLLYGIVKGESIENSALMANAVASLKCRAVGARTALPRVDELRSFLKNS